MALTQSNDLAQIILPRAESMDACPALLIPGETLHCDDFQDSHRSRTRWIIEDSENGTCPALVKDPLEVPRHKGVQIAATHSSSEDRIFVIVRVIGGPYKDQTQSCKSSLSDQTATFTLEFSSMSEQAWQATGTLHRKEGSIELSDILISPAK